MWVLHTEHPFKLPNNPAGSWIGSSQNACGSRTSECDRIWKQGFCRVPLRWGHSRWIRTDPKSKNQCPYRRSEDTQTHREDSHLKTEAEIKVMLPQAKECPGPPETGRSKEGSLRGFLPKPWFQTFSLQSCERIKFCCFKPPSCGNLLW